jgi:hypothetical protein
MNARYGTAVTRGDAVVYESADAAKAIVRSHILIRNSLKEKPAKATAPAAAEPAAPAAPPAAAPAPPASAPVPEKKE